MRLSENAVRSKEYSLSPLVKAWRHQQIHNAQAMRLRNANRVCLHANGRPSGLICRGGVSQMSCKTMTLENILADFQLLNDWETAIAT